MAKAFRYGDNIDTDVIIPARYLTSTDEAELAQHALEDLDPGFVKDVEAGDVLFAGKNFGCGSSREHAPMALRGTGLAAVVADSFARIFFRNAINRGLSILVCPEAVNATEFGDEIEVDVIAGRIVNVTKDKTFYAEPLPDFVTQIVDAGGLIPYVRARLQGVS